LHANKIKCYLLLPASAISLVPIITGPCTRYQPMTVADFNVPKTGLHRPPMTE